MNEIYNPHDVGLVKTEWLSSHGFVWMFEYGVWVDAARKQLLSYEYVASTDLSSIETEIEEPGDDGDLWRMLFTDTPSAEVVDAIITQATERAR